MFGKLSSPLTLCGDIADGLIIAYDYFSHYINDKENRPQLFGKKIYVEAHEWIEDRPEGFWHLVSLEEKHHFQKILPCINDSSTALCKQNCNTKQKMIAIKMGTENRSLCLYRASRIPWVVDIINLANNNDPDVCVWIKPSTNGSSDKLYLRYNHDGADYVVIFSVEKKFYRIIAAFPVFYLSEKEAFDKEYLAFGVKDNP